VDAEFYDYDGQPNRRSEPQRLAHVAGLFRALGDPLRLKIYELACDGRGAGVTIGEIVEKTGAKQSLASFHVKKLVEAALLVQESSDNRRSGYRIHETSFTDMSRWQASLTDGILEEVRAARRASLIADNEDEDEYEDDDEDEGDDEDEDEDDDEDFDDDD
jgi:DNA-binding transcriptional ArsR family regulator